MNYKITRLLELKDTSLLDQYIWLQRAWSMPFIKTDWTTIPTTSIRQNILREEKLATRRWNWVIHQDEKLIGEGYIGINKTHDQNNFNIFVYIKPEYQKQGLAKLLTIHMLNHIDTAGLTVVHVDTRDLVTPSGFDTFLESAGFKNVYQERMSGANFQDYDKLAIENEATSYRKLAEELGYCFEVVNDGGISELSCSPDAFYRMREEVWNDMPKEDADWDYEPYNEAIHKDMYKQIEDGTSTLMVVVLKNDQPVGMTETWFNADIDLILHQGDTGVLKSDRGHQLGKTLKLILLDLLLKDHRTKNVQKWITGNAGSNVHMIRINDYLQYKELEIEKCYEMDFEEFKKIINKSN